MLKPEELRDIRKELVILKSGALNTSFETRILEMQSNSIILKNPVPLENISEFIKGESYTLQVRDLSFEGRAVEGSGMNLRLWLKGTEPVDQLENSKRKSDRVYFQEDDEVYCKFINPIDQKTNLKKRVVDISKSGFSLITVGNSKLFTKGLKLEDVHISGDLAEDIHCDAEVKYFRNYISLSGESCNQVGLEIYNSK